MTQSWSKTVLGACVAVGVFAGGITTASADDPALALKQRKAVMSSLGAHMAGIKTALAAGNGDVVAAHAGAINKIAGVLPTFFPQGSGMGETRAKPEIWARWAEFETAAGNLVAESGKLAGIAKGGDGNATMAQFGQMGKVGCGGCHKPFRKPKDK